MSKEHVKTANMDDYLNEVQGLERDYLGEVLKSRKTAWRISGVAIIGMFACIGVSAVALYQKPPPPHLLRLDNKTGLVDMITTMKTQEKSYGELADKYWIRQYIVKRESYNYYTVQDEYDAIGLMSEQSIARQYRKIFEGENARDAILGSENILEAKVQSIVINPDTNVARVNFKTRIKNTSAAATKWTASIATISYEYSQIPMYESQRLINPLGFQVVSYKVDPVNSEL